VFDVLIEFADVAANVLVGLKAERDDGNETEREPLPSFVNACAVVTAVLALCCDVLVAFKERGECVSATSEDESHVAYCRDNATWS